MTKKCPWHKPSGTEHYRVYTCCLFTFGAYVNKWIIHPRMMVVQHNNPRDWCWLNIALLIWGSLSWTSSSAIDIPTKSETSIAQKSAKILTRGLEFSHIKKNNQKSGAFSSEAKTKQVSKFQGVVHRRVYGQPWATIWRLLGSVYTLLGHSRE